MAAGPAQRCSPCAPLKLERVFEPADIAPRSRCAPRKIVTLGIAVALAGLSLAGLSLAGCAKMDSALGQQWIVVQFNPNTTVAAARQVTQACSHVPNLRVGPVRPTSANSDIIESVRYNATNATDANMARLQGCLQRFSSVQGVNLLDAGDS
jgi:hypothetical protein